VTESSENLGNEWLNVLEEDIDITLLDIHSLDSEETSEEIDFSNLDKLHENYLSQERMRLGLVNTIHAGATPMKSFINSPEQESVKSIVNVVSDSPMDRTKMSKLPSGLTIDLDCLKCLEENTMLSGAGVNFLETMETTTFIAHNKLGEHYLLSCDTWDYIEMFTNPKAEYNFELA
jgi:hypothetical protein